MVFLILLAHVGIVCGLSMSFLALEPGLIAAGPFIAGGSGVVALLVTECKFWIHCSQTARRLEGIGARLDVIGTHVSAFDLYRVGNEVDGMINEIRFQNSELKRAVKTGRDVFFEELHQLLARTTKTVVKELAGVPTSTILKGDELVCNQKSTNGRN